MPGGNLTLIDLGVLVTFLVSLISGIIFLKNNLKKWISSATADQFEELNEKVDAVQKEVGDLRADQSRGRTDDARYRILRFYDELLHGVNHTKEHFEQIIYDIDTYEKFCAAHKDTYKNNMADLAIDGIRRVYKRCEQEGSFL